MTTMSRMICCALLMLAAGCAANVSSDRAEGPIHWGQTVAGLQVGIAPVKAAAPPNQPQAAESPTLGVQVYLRNDGDAAITVVDPTGPAGSNSPEQPTLWSIFTEPDHTAQVDHVRPLPAVVQTLSPGQMINYFVDLSPILSSHQGPHIVIAEYDNPDSEIIISSQPSKTAGNVWTGQARSDELQLNDNP